MGVKQFRSIKRVPCWYLTIVHNALNVNKVSNEWKVSEQVNYRSVKSEATFQREKVSKSCKSFKHKLFLEDDSHEEKTNKEKYNLIRQVIYSRS